MVLVKPKQYFIQVTLSKSESQHKPDFTKGIKNHGGSLTWGSRGNSRTSNM